MAEDQRAAQTLRLQPGHQLLAKEAAPDNDSVISRINVTLVFGNDTKTPCRVQLIELALHCLAGGLCAQINSSAL
ncbi:hypothetical protein D3C72_1022730 [compost metagenome]